VSVGIGDFVVSTDPSVVLYTVLGSCVGVIAYVSWCKVGGFLHIKFPHLCEATEQYNCPPRGFANTGIPLFLDALEAEGCVLRRLRIDLAGGGVDSEKGLRIGPQNIEAVKQMLFLYRLPIRRECVGGAGGYAIRMPVATGILEIKRLSPFVSG
jgi:chemotaxis protein CheD